MGNNSLITTIFLFLCVRLLANVSSDSLGTEILDKSSNSLHYSLPPLTIVIDPGHGGKDAGCSGRHSQEKDIVLAVGKIVRDKLLADHPNVTLVLTREKDEFIPLHQRAKKANQLKADIFISLHCNSIPGKSHVHGSETYVLGLHRADDNLAVAKRENAAILLEDNYKAHYDGFDPNSPEGHILLSLVQNAFLEQSIALAKTVEYHLTHTASRHSRGVKQAGFLVLRETTMPSVLIEMGFLTNKTEEDFLRDTKGQEKVASSIISAILDYAKQYLDPVPENKELVGEQSAFGIQLLLTTNPLADTHPIRQNYPDLKELKTDKGYKYFLPAGNTRDHAAKIKNQAAKDGFPDAFIIALGSK